MQKSLYTLLFLLTAAAAGAQQMPERSLVRKGNRQYAKGNYEESIRRYEQALEAVPGQFEATYDLGNAPLQGRTLRPRRTDPPAGRRRHAASGDGAWPKPITIWATRSSSSRSTRRRSKATSNRCG